MERIHKLKKKFKSFTKVRENYMWVFILTT